MKERKSKPCLIKQLLNMFKLQCEWGFSLRLCNKEKGSWYSWTLDKLGFKASLVTIGRLIESLFLVTDWHFCSLRP